MNIQEFKEKYKISKIYAYHQIPKDKKNIEFGWKEVLELDLSKPIVISRAKDSELDNATSLSDYEKFFLSITGQTSKEFIKKWKDKPLELKDYWQINFPFSEQEQDEFMMKLSMLICDGTAFEMYERTYEIFRENV